LLLFDTFCLANNPTHPVPASQTGKQKGKTTTLGCGFLNAKPSPTTGVYSQF
jgi:hypothetical protein